MLAVSFVTLHDSGSTLIWGK